jgi:methanogenic corrinoid protein MtbC1
MLFCLATVIPIIKQAMDTMQTKGLRKKIIIFFGPEDKFNCEIRTPIENSSARKKGLL